MRKQKVSVYVRSHEPNLRSMLPQSLLALEVRYILAKMTTIHKSQVDASEWMFLSELYRMLFAMRGRVSFIILARYSVFYVQTFRRHFQLTFNLGHV